MLIDSHCHLEYKGLVEDQAGVLDRARQAGEDHAIKADRCIRKYAARSAGLLAPFCIERHGFRQHWFAVCIEIRHAAVAHQKEAASFCKAHR